jgi:deoxyribose-phosphate aldolase
MDNGINQISSIRKELESRFVRPHKPNAKVFQPVKTANLASRIDHTLLKADATIEQIQQLCEEAIKHQFYSVCIHGSFILLATQILKGTNIKPITVVGFPTGANSTETKVFETLDAIDNGAQEIDMVLHVGKLKSGLLEDVYHDILSIVAQADHVPVKVILETSMLTLEEKIQGCVLSQLAGAAFVKTSTGFAGGATIDDVKLMKAVVDDTMGVKASGGIKDLKTALQMIDAGADRIGTSNSVAIISESKTV